MVGFRDKEEGYEDDACPDEENIEGPTPDNM
jgi:hypothetical protein